MIYRIPVTWMMTGVCFVRAETKENAIDIAMHAELPSGDYLDDSFQVAEDEIVEVSEQQTLGEKVID